MDALPIEMEAAIARSRVYSLQGDFSAALDMLHKVAADGSASQIAMVTAEVIRVAFFQADHNHISNTTFQGALDDHILSDLLRLASTTNQIWTNLDLRSPVKLANTMFKKYSHTLVEDNVNEFTTELRILFYCTVVHDWHRMYGDGLPPPQYQWDESFLRTLVLKLAQHQLYLEMLDVLEFLVDNPEHSLQSFVTLSQSSSVHTHTPFILCLARIQCRRGDFDQATASLQSISSGQNVTTIRQKFKSVMRTRKAKSTSGSSSSNTVSALHHTSLIEQRYLAQSSSASDRVGKLLCLVDVFTTRLDYLTAFKALEYAAELLNEIPDLSVSLRMGDQIHQLLDSLCLRNGDQLSKALIEFRYCDLLNSAGGDFALARDRRANLLNKSMCDKLPYFQRFHHRQWAEYYMLHQRQLAIAHAQKYHTYCQTCRSGQDQSGAQTAVFQSLMLPERVSDDLRLGALESLKQSILRAVKDDTKNHWLREAVEKQLVLVEIVHEIGRIEEEDPEVTASNVVNVLESAEFIVSELSGRADCAALKCQILFLRTSAALFLGQQDVRDHDRPIMLASKGKLEISRGDYMEKADTGVYLKSALSAIMTESLSGFKTVHDELADRLSRPATKGDAARKVALMSARGQIYYFLTEFGEEQCKKFWTVAGASSLKHMREKALQNFEEAFRLRTEIAAETRDLGSMSSTATELASSQAYYALNAQTQLDLDMAIEIVYELNDSRRTWQWIQQGKAYAFAQVLARSLSLDRALAADFPVSSDTTLEGLQFIQSASVYQLVFVDWISFGMSRKRLLMSICRWIGKDCRTTQVELEVDLDDLREAVARVTEARMDDSEAQRYLQPFMPLIQPLQEASNPGDILLLSPTSPFHNIPLHAVLLESQVLIERNPVVYVPSQSTLTTCLNRLAAPTLDSEAPKEWKAVVAAAYEDETLDSSTSDERSEVYKCAAALTSSLQGDSLLGQKLTENVTSSILASADMFHFHGHSLSGAHRPSEQRLALGEGYMTTSQIASLKMRAAHVCLIACSSASQDFSLSFDEPHGLMAAFLLGGAVSVLGALWPIQSSTGRMFTDLYYKYFLEHVDRQELGPIVNIAKALQNTVLEIRKRPDTARHYHWAPYISYGSWFCKRKPGSW